MLSRVICAVDRARLARDFDLRLELLLAFRRNDVDLHVVEERGRAALHDVRGAAMECMKAAMDHTSKMAEIRRAREIVQERRDAGAYQGRPWTGLQFDDDGQYLVPDEDSDEWQAIETVLDRHSDADEVETGNLPLTDREITLNQSELARQTCLSREQVRRVLDRRKAYDALRDGARIGYDGQVVWPTRADSAD